MVEQIDRPKQLTKRAAVSMTRRLWKILAESGEDRQAKGSIADQMFGHMWGACPLCEYAARRTIASSKAARAAGTCPSFCPYHEQFGNCMRKPSPYYYWEGAATPKLRQKYAKAILAQLDQL